MTDDIFTKGSPKLVVKKGEGVLRVIKDCPFCGNRDKVEVKDDYDDDYAHCYYFSVVCRACGGRGPWELSMTEAVDMWNRRAKE